MFPEAPGTHPVLNLCLCPRSLGCSTKNTTPQSPSPITVEILSAFSRLSSDAHLFHTKPPEPSHSCSHNEKLFFPPLPSLSTLLFPSEDKFSLVLALSWDMGCLSCQMVSIKMSHASCFPPQHLAQGFAKSRCLKEGY